MTLKAAYLAGALALLAGCDTAQKAVDDAARVTAKATVEKVLTAHLPETVPAKLVTPYSSCIIDNASAKHNRLGHGYYPAPRYNHMYCQGLNWPLGLLKEKTDGRVQTSRE
jgi:hypothetical protein